MDLSSFIEEESQTKFLKETPKSKKDSNKKITICLSDDENVKLREIAGAMPLSIFIKEQLRQLKVI
ncbi:MAG: hypothetical protein KC471_01355 [Flavobacteriaceae bacterium]|nr:hypothetical protein [Flavobacteriaceae bacterium]